MPEITYAELNQWEGKLHNAVKRLDKMKTKGSPDANALSYELAGLKEQISEKIKEKEEVEQQ